MQQGSRLCARQTKGSPHAPEIPTRTPAVNLRFDIDCLAQGLEGKGLDPGANYENVCEDVM